ncbi:MAG: phosphatidate cytidylyltransferase [Lachnospiraceae bacterium]|nr:phosphatidate cytidylyltransferase [Lachnospiraceae bacterium]
MLKTRLISGVVLILIALAALMAGGPVLGVLMLAVSLIGMFELYRVTAVQDGLKSPLALVGYAAAVLYYVVLMNGGAAYLTSVLAMTLIAMMFVFVFSHPRYRTAQITAAFFGLVYLAMMLSCIYRIRLMIDGIFTVWLVFFAAWGCDSFAYVFGRLFGRHKLSPVLSPKKTVEGAVGGVAGAAALGAAFAAIAGPHMTAGYAPVAEYALICGAGGMISMVGDLAASAIKREFQVKDYGKLIPGHGGILDRFDSVIFTAPVIYLLACLIF